jgi:arylsulfatase A-like enzyme
MDIMDRKDFHRMATASALESLPRATAMQNSAGRTTKQWSRRDFCSAGAVALAQRVRVASRPNVVIFYVDELRATALKMYRSDGVDTPNLARLTARGVIFEHNFTAHTLCMPARASLWTGEYSHTVGSRCNQMPLRDDRRSMAGILHDAGYRLGLFGKNHCFTPAQRECWFAADCSTSNPPSGTFAGAGGLNSKSWNQAISASLAAEMKEHHRWIRSQGGLPASAPFPPEVFETHLVAERALEFIDHAGSAPFAAWISISDPHPPYQAPEKFVRLVSPDRLKLPPFRDGEMKTKNTRMQIFNYLTRGPELSEVFLRHYLSIYYAMTLFVDWELGRVLDLLERKKLTENTIVLFTADHGDFATEHHLREKTGCLLDCLARVPLVFSWPGHVPEGRRESALVNQVDIMPTLLEFCGLPIPTDVEGRRLPFDREDSRRSFVYSEYGAGGPYFTWEDARKIGPTPVLGTYSLGRPNEREALVMRERAGHLQMIRTLTHKLIQDSNGESEFYDLMKDPYELDNVHGRSEYRTLEEELRRKLQGPL